jgi:hypothetical protein
VDPFTVSLNISKPREEVFEYLADIANHPEFTDHYLVDWRVTLAELEPPFRIVQRGRGGKYNRTRMLGTYTLQPGPSNSTRLEYTLETVPKLPSDRIMEALGGKQWTRRQTGKAVRRLRTILEEGRDRGKRATIAGR